MNESDTICAIATGQGEAGIGIVRVSGARSVQCVAGLYRGAKALGEHESHRAHYGAVWDKEERLEVDQGLFLVMKAPHSYTGEDVVEIQAHGSRYLLGKILTLLLREGARLAEPGEFTRRAFLNGRLDLAQAEAVMQLISVKNDAQHRLALSQLRGQLSERIGSIRDLLRSLLGELEAAIDFSDQEIPLTSRVVLMNKCDALSADLRDLLKNYEMGRRIREGFTVAIIGRPNVGKSSLMNALLQDDRAIVSRNAGTTRDVLREEVHIGGLGVTLVDTAGLREGREEAEIEGISRARAVMNRADLILCVLDGHCALQEEDLLVLKECSERDRIVVLTKSDLGSVVDEADVRSVAGVMGPVVVVSAVEGLGLEQLQSEIHSELKGEISAEQPQVALLRHKEAIVAATEAVRCAGVGIGDGLSPEFPASDLRAGLDCLLDITGETTVDDVLNEVFSQFCIGK